MTGSSIRDADVSVLSLPRDEPPHEPRRRTRWFAWLAWIIAAGLCLTGAYWALPMVDSVPEVETAPIRMIGSPAPPATLNASGYIVAQRQASVATKGTGRLEYLGVTVGSRVKAGDIIARVQQDDVRAVQNQARARLDVAKAALMNAQAEMREARLSYSRAEALLPNQFISQAEFDAASNRLRRAEAAVRSASASITAAEADVQSADVMLTNTVIRAPFDGTVLKKFAEVGEVVAPMASSANSRGAVVLIADMTSLEVETEISESSIARITPGQTADITLDAAPEQHYPGVVAQIVPTADRSKGTVLAKVRFSNIDDRVLPEMSTKVSFLAPTQSLASSPPRFTVPTSAVTRKEGRALLYTVTDDIVQKIPIEPLSNSGEQSEVRGGLTASSRVILVPSPTLEPGMRVRTRERSD